MEYQEDDFLLLSGIQHYTFCKRQWALIHIEQQWQENLRTVEGAILHEKTHDSTIKEKRGTLIISRGMGVFSRTLGITGACDVVEFHRSRDGVTLYGREGTYLPVPVEYKRGKPKQDNADVLFILKPGINVRLWTMSMPCSPLSILYWLMTPRQPWKPLAWTLMWDFCTGTDRGGFPWPWI